MRKLMLSIAVVVVLSCALWSVKDGLCYDDSAYGDAQGTASDTAYFDGGSGSTINTSTTYSSSVPEVQGQPIGYQDQDGNYHSY